MKQTSIEFLLRELRIEDLAKGEQLSVILEICQQAKEMHKQEIINTYEQAMETDVYNTPLKTGKQYYNETFNK